MYFSLNDCQFKTSRLSSKDYQFKTNMGLPDGSVVKESACQKEKKKKKICLPMQETQVQSLVQEDPLEKEMTTHSSILACWTA